jgi:hypothetical protein
MTFRDSQLRREDLAAHLTEADWRARFLGAVLRDPSGGERRRGLG